VVAKVFEFGEFKLDCDRFELRRQGQILRLEKKPLELLILLAACEGRLVTRTEISQSLWGSEVFVDTEHGINTAIRKIRRVLDDDPEQPRFVQTVTGKGYRFIAPVATAETLGAAFPTVKQPEPGPIVSAAPSRKHPTATITASACALLVIIGVAAYRSLLLRPPEIKYTQLTDFTDSAVAPALSPDGRMLAFIRGNDGFLSADQIWLKSLPDGEPRRLTNDGRLKYGLAFSPDGSEIAYSVLEPPTFSTYTVSIFGGESHLLLRNAAGLNWLDSHRLLFSQIRSGIHLGVVTATEARADFREIYYPAHERGMAHYSYPSPNRKWALVVEMDGNGEWAPCRLVSIDGGSPARSIGPSVSCTSAGWSPDGTWMYFSAAVDGRSHLWRQRFPEGPPEQITFGPTEEDGVAVEPAGQALITSLGVHESAIWIHDAQGDRPLSSEGEAVAGISPPAFSQDDKVLYYLLRHGKEGSGAELWRMFMGSGRSEPVFPGVFMLAYDVSPDSRRVVYSAAAPGGKTQLWVAPIDKGSPASKVGETGGMWPHFGAGGQILFQVEEGNSNYLEQMNLDGSGRTKVVAYPIVEVQGISPGRRWIMAMVPASPGDNGPAPMAIPLDGGPPQRICKSYCVPVWSPNGKFLFIPVEAPSRTSAGRSLAIPVGPGESLPAFPPGGIEPLADVSVMPGSLSVPRADLVPGIDPAHYAYVNTTVHRNLYRISLP
jgi:DNA-binding winged helix-turn-helix (wHTH) protein